MFKKIITSWLISLNPDEKQKEVALNRIEVCNNCEENKYSKLFDIYLCDKCKCPLSKKVYTENKEDCPLRKWII